MEVVCVGESGEADHHCKEANMARNAKKAERRRLKRQQKRSRLRRAEGDSPYRRIGAHGEVVACYLNANWRKTGEAAIYCLRSIPGGGHAMAAFLVDVWCMGLKDAWGHLGISADEFNESILRWGRRDLDLTRIDADLAQRLVAGGIRFARQNGFRLPKRHERWVALLGGVGDVDTADLEEFGVDGGLRYIGSTEDLSKRLIGCTVEQFLTRDDVKFILGGDDFSLLDGDELGVEEDDELNAEEDDELDVEEVADDVHAAAVSAVRRWCFANGMQPHPRLPEAWAAVFDVIALLPAVPEDGELAHEDSQIALDFLGRLLAVESAETGEDMSEAMSQIHAFMKQFDSPAELFEYVGLEESL